MKLQCFLLIILFFFGSCRLPEIKPENEKEIIKDIDPFEMNDAQLLFKSSMVAWEFLKKHPTEGEVLKYFGDPDSSWVDENDKFKILYLCIRGTYNIFTSIKVEKLIYE